MRIQAQILGFQIEGLDESLRPFQSTDTMLIVWLRESVLFYSLSDSGNAVKRVHYSGPPVLRVWSNFAGKTKTPMPPSMTMKQHLSARKAQQWEFQNHQPISLLRCNCHSRDILGWVCPCWTCCGFRFQQRKEL